MRLKAALLMFGVSFLLSAQAALSIEQLVAFIRSSIQLKQEDKQVAAYLKRQKLTERLDERTIEQLQGEGAGPKTVEALRDLSEESKALPAPKKVVAEPPKPVEIPPPSPEEQRKIIEQVREYALGYTKQLPDFICTQVTRRYVDPAGLEFWRQQDVITTRLSYFEQKENYKVIMVNNRVTDVSYDALGGATSAGEFGSMMREIFEPETQTDFRWTRWATLRGRRTHVFTYRVAQARSKYQVDYQKREQVVPGYHGLIYVDRDTLDVARITLEAELPSTFPLQQASTVLDYDSAEISGHKYMLPLKAEVRMRENRLLVKNDVEFRLYRKFAAEASISFETPDPLPDEKTKEQPPQP